MLEDILKASYSYIITILNAMNLVLIYSIVEFVSRILLLSHGHIAVGARFASLCAQLFVHKWMPVW